MILKRRMRISELSLQMITSKQEKNFKPRTTKSEMNGLKDMMILREIFRLKMPD